MIVIRAQRLRLVSDEILRGTILLEEQPLAFDELDAERRRERMTQVRLAASRRPHEHDELGFSSPRCAELARKEREHLRPGVLARFRAVALGGREILKGVAGLSVT